MASEVGMGVCRVEVFDGEEYARLDGLKAPGSEFFAFVPLFLSEPVKAKGAGGRPLLRVELAAAPPGARVQHLSVAIVNAISAALQAHGPYVPCSDPAAYARRHDAAKAWLSTMSPPTVGPLGRWRGRDVVAPFVRGVLERLVGSFSLAPEHALRLVEGLGVSGAAEIAESIRKGGSWPVDMDGAALDEEHRTAAADHARSEAARARNVAEAGKVVDMIVGDEGIEGFRCRAGTQPAFEHLINTRAAFAGASVVRPPTLVQGGWSYWLRRQIPGEPLPAIELPDGSGTVPRDTVLRMAKGQAASISGCWQDWLTVRRLREQYGVIDRRPIREDEFIGEADPRLETVLEHARALVQQHRVSIFNQMTAPWLRVHVASALVRAYLLRPEIAAACVVASLPDPTAPDETPQRGMLMPITGVANTMSYLFPEEEEPEPNAPSTVLAPAPAIGWPAEEVEAACLAAADGDTLWAQHSPGVLLEPLKPTLLQKVARLAKQDPWEPILRAALRDRPTDRLRTEELVELVAQSGEECSVERTADTSRIKKILERIGWSRREFEQKGERFRAYSRVA